MILQSILLFTSISLGLGPFLPVGASRQSHLVQESLQYRVAFDMGSGSLKMQAAWVEPLQNRIVKVAHTESIVLPVREAIDLDPNGNIPENVVEKLRVALKQMQEVAEKDGKPVSYVAGATEAYRAANNGEAVLTELGEELGISMFLLTQDEEARLGYQSLKAEGLLDEEEHSLIWENGGGSTQLSGIVDGALLSYNLQVGKVPMKNHLIHEIQGKTGQTPNPIGKEEALEAIDWAKEQFRDAPEWVNEKTVCIGIGAMYPNVQKGLGKSTFTKEDLWLLIEERIGKSDEELSPEGDSNAPFLLSDLLFLYGAMDELGIQEVTCPKQQGPGSTSGLLT